MGEIDMFRSTVPAAEPAYDEVDLVSLIPISQLELDLPAPSVGWLIELDRRHVTVLTDDIGRPAIARSDARQLFDEHREAEARRREAAERREREAIEANRLWRSQVWTGLPADSLPVGVGAGAAMAQAARDDQPKRQSPMEEALSGESMTYHAWPNEDESS
jgi:hypothetical protein